jgi:predicted outer membrane repeat protein
MKKTIFLNLLMMLFVSSFFAADFYVSAAGNDTTGDGTVGNPYLTVHTAVIAASANDNIIIVGAVSQTVSTTIGKNLTFTGTSNASVTRSTTGNLFTVTGAFTISFTNITFQNVTATTAGAAFSITGPLANVTFTNCTLSGNSSSGNNGGGAMFVGNTSTVTLTNCLATGNSTTNGPGGAISVIANAVLNISGSTFHNNSATTQGGAIRFLNSASSTITKSTFFNNKINLNDAFSGGAIRGNNTTNTVTVTNCLFYNNRGNAGAGSYTDFSVASGGTFTANNSIAQQFTNVTSNNSYSDATDFLSASNLTFSSPNVTFTAPDALTDKTPIDFGSDTQDIGAWDSKINIFKGGASGAIEAWINTTNWSNGTLPNATDNLAILTGGACTLDGEATINDIKVTGRLDIKTNRVLIVNGTSNVTGTVRYSRVLTSDADSTKAWHLVSSPLSGEVFDATYLTVNDIASGTNTGGNINMGIATYNPGQTGAAAWSYYNTGTNSNITANSSQGYSMKITPDGVTTGGEFVDNIVTFEGDFNTNNAGVTTSSLPLGFNLLGNPYTSFVNSATFLAANSNIDQTQIWVWNQATGMYEVKIAGASFVLAPAQGFFANVTTAGTLNFAEANQATTGDSFQKSSRTELKLVMTDGTSSRFAQIYFLDNATKGFDFGWEGETFGGIANSLDVFTNLVAENQGKKYQVQSLPISEMETMIVPLGIKATAGKEITFTAEAMNLPTDVKVYLEDRTTNTITRLDEANTSYKVTLNDALNGIGRFYLHTKSSNVLSTNDVVLQNISVHASNNATLRVVGLPSGSSNLKVYNILGKQVLQSTFTSTGIKEISLPKLATGVYLIQLETEAGKLNKKIILE